MSCEILKELYRVSYLYEYVPLRSPITKEHCDELLENYKSSRVGYCIDWISKTLLGKLRVRTILILFCLVQLFLLLINLQILLILLGWLNSSDSEDVTFLPPETFQTVDLFFTGTFSPLSTISVDGMITFYDTFWFLLRFSFSFLVLCHLFLLLRCFSISCASRTWYLVMMQLFFSLTIPAARYYTTKSPDNSTILFSLVFLLIRISTFIFYLLLLLYTQHFMKQESYILTCLALEWPYYYGFKHYVFNNYLNTSFFVFGSSLEKMPLNPICVTLPPAIDQP